MARDGIREARAQHDELMLAFTLRRSHGAADRIVQTAELALGAAIHVPHARDDGVGLVVEIQTIGNELVELDVGRAFERTPSAGTAAFAAVAITAGAVATIAIVRTVPAWPISTGTIPALSLSTRPRWSSILAIAARRTVLALLFLLRFLLLLWLGCGFLLGRSRCFDRRLRGRSLIWFSLRFVFHYDSLTSQKVLTPQRTVWPILALRGQRGATSL